MNLPSLNKYENVIKPGGVLIVNSSMVDRPTKREDIIIKSLPGNEIAEQLGTPKSLNMVMLGALLSKLPVFPLEEIARINGSPYA